MPWIRRFTNLIFGLANFLEPSLHQVLTKLMAENRLANLDASTLASRAANFLGELNAPARPSSYRPCRIGEGENQSSSLPPGMHYGDNKA